MSRHPYTLFALVLICLASHAAENPDTSGKDSADFDKYFPVKNHAVSLGAGFGLDYGGIGMNIAFLPVPYLSIFTAAGFQIVSAGWNVGLKFHMVPVNSKTSFRTSLKVMYGVNRAIMVKGASQYNDTYMGFTPGIGFEWMFSDDKSRGVYFDVNVPINKEFDDSVDALKKVPGIEMGVYLPFAISFGVHMEL